jgi:hypothetical protein
MMKISLAANPRIVFTCDSQDLTLQAILSNGVASVRQTLRRMFSAMAAERAKKRRKLVQTPGYDNYQILDHSSRDERHIERGEAGRNEMILGRRIL